MSKQDHQEKSYKCAFHFAHEHHRNRGNQKLKQWEGTERNVDVKEKTKKRAKREEKVAETL